jgi:DNA-binding HxlR family transcriptional regulator
MSKSYEQFCPVARTLDLLGDRWTLLIIRDLFFGKRRFADFEESLAGIPPNVLSDRLKLLEAHGIAERTFYSDHPPRAEYHLTRKGRDLHWVLEAIAAWGAKYAFETRAFRQVHAGCGHPASLAWRCTHCGETVPPSTVVLERLAESDEP